MYDLIQSGLAVVLPMWFAERIKGLHLNPAHWGIKQDKPQGRPIIDYKT
jgi:hypothetical protein